jgi:alpha-ketoglutarate-dependent 2,4-dichlorophenoxyacetate dioxygenase
LDVRPLHPLFAAELVGADLSVEPGADLVETVEAAMARYGILVVRDARISDEQHKRFSRAFGPLELPSRSKDTPMIPPGKRRFDPDLFYAGNIDGDGEIVPYNSDRMKYGKGAERFHTDSSFHDMPTKWSLLLGHETPPSEAGGDTLFVDGRVAWETLPEQMRTRLEGLTGIHDFWEGRRRAGLQGEITPEMRKMIPFMPARHPVARHMPYGRTALFVGGHCVGIEGLDNGEAHALIEDLYAHATQDRFVYRHHWRQHDLVIWDNRCTMHAATPLLTDRYRRDMRRTTINEYGAETSAFKWMGLDGGA